MFIGSVLLYSLFTLLHNDTAYYNRFQAICQVFFGNFFKNKNFTRRLNGELMITRVNWYIVVPKKKDVGIADVLLIIDV